MSGNWRANFCRCLPAAHELAHGSPLSSAAAAAHNEASNAALRLATLHSGFFNSECCGVWPASTTKIHVKQPVMANMQGCPDAVFHVRGIEV